MIQSVFGQTAPLLSHKDPARIPLEPHLAQTSEGRGGRRARDQTGPKWAETTRTELVPNQNPRVQTPLPGSSHLGLWLRSQDLGGSLLGAKIQGMA